MSRKLDRWKLERSEARSHLDWKVTVNISSPIEWNLMAFIARESKLSFHRQCFTLEVTVYLQQTENSPALSWIINSKANRTSTSQRKSRGEGLGGGRASCECTVANASARRIRWQKNRSAWSVLTKTERDRQKRKDRKIHRSARSPPEAEHADGGTGGSDDWRVKWRRKMERTDRKRKTDGNRRARERERENETEIGKERSVMTKLGDF